MLVADDPWVTDWSPKLEKPKSKLACIWSTVKLKLVDFVIPPPLPVTVIVLGPAGVETDVSMLRVVEQVGVHEVEEKDTVAPVGRPETEKKTSSGVPEARVAVTMLVADDPWVTDWSPKLETLKSKDWVLS